MAGVALARAAPVDRSPVGGSTVTGTEARPLLELRGLYKSFGAVQVLHDVDLSLRVGEVTALVGDNGAGKSTLVKCVSGIYAADSGEIRFDGRPVTIHNPRDAGHLGIEVVYQDLALCDNLDIVQNMFLGRERRSGVVLDEPTMEQMASKTLTALAVRTVTSVRQQVASLSGGQRQTVAIAKAVLWNSRIVILDEPTAALGVAQTAQVLELVRRLADNGLAVLLISHNMNEVFAVSDSIAALYLGRMVAQVRTTDVSHSEVVQLITAGRSGGLGIQASDGSSYDGSGYDGSGIRRQWLLEPVRTRRERSRPMTTLRTYADTAPVEQQPFGAHVSAYARRVRGGEMGALPAIFGLLALCTVFSILRPAFLTAGNLANLLPQGAAVTAIAMGLVFVLLLGEIDLSAGFTSGVCASVLAIALTEYGVSWYVAVLAAIAIGSIVGLILGTLVAKIGIPSFVVTLAAFLAFQGVVLLLIKGGTIISITDPVILAIGNKFLSPAAGWLCYGVSVAAYAAVQLVRRNRRQARGLPSDPLSLVVVRVVALAAFIGAAVYVLNQERSRNIAIASLKGVPIVVPILVVLLVLLTFVLKRTGYGLHIYAVGGNREAARRAGINIDAIRISAFVICSTMAAVGGIIAASRANSVDANTGGSNVLLYAVGAAVIGGTSLFGGKGRVLDAVLGGAVVAVIDNGMGLMGYTSGVKFIVTGMVLLLAAGVDALSRRRAAAAGLR